MLSFDWPKVNQALRTKFEGALTVTLFGTKVTDSVVKHWIWLLGLMLSMWVDVLGRWGSLGSNIEDELLRWCHNTIGTIRSIDEFLGSLNSVRDTVLELFQNYTEVTNWYSWLKTMNRKNGFKWVMSPLKPFIDQISENPISGLRDLLQCCSFPLRANPVEWSRLNTTTYLDDDPLAWDTYVSYLEKMDEYYKEDHSLPVRVSLPKTCVRWCTSILSGFSLKGKSRYFSFSTGATAQTKRGWDAMAKWQYLVSSSHGTSIETLAWLTYWTGDDWLTASQSCPILPTYDYVEEEDSTSTLTPVPKQWDKPRLITQEPLCKNWLQKGIGDVLVDYLTTGPLRDHYVANDQTWNQKGALIGSLSGQYATIDLSSASDSVSWALVCAMLSDSNSDLLRMLDMSRSRYVDIEGRVYRLRKFAGMGNRCTFPIEVLVFSMFVTEAIRITKIRENIPASDLKIWFVYGDDIVVHTAVVPVLVNLLTTYGFRVNSRKTFCNDSAFTFRESCGKWYLNGIDITPCLLSRKLPIMVDAGKGANWPPSYIQLANALKQKGLLTARLYVLTSMKRHLAQREWPIFDDIDESCVLSDEPTNYDKIVPLGKGLHSAYLNDIEEHEFYAGRTSTVGGRDLIPIPFPFDGEVSDKVLRSMQYDENRGRVYPYEVTNPRKGRYYTSFVLYETLRCMELRKPSNSEGQQPYRIGEIFPCDEGRVFIDLRDSVWRSRRVSDALYGV